MKTRQKILLGGLGALTPIVLNLLVVDLRVTLENLTALVLLGYALRVVVLFYLGGIVAFLHKDENSPLKLFEFGIAAPALIIAMLNAGNVPKSPYATSGAPRISVSFISSAYAQTTPSVKTFAKPKESAVEQLWRGLTGSTFQKTWFVIVGSHLNLEDAEKQVQEIAANENQKDFRAEVFAPYGGNPYYAVVIGANLTFRDALELQKQAIAAGFPQDTYLWMLEPDWFAVLASYGESELQNAQDHARKIVAQLAEQGESYQVEIYRTKISKSLAVTVGGRLARSEAVALARMARAKNWAHDAYAQVDRDWAFVEVIENRED